MLHSQNFRYFALGCKEKTTTVAMKKSQAQKNRESKEWKQRDKIFDDIDTPKDESSIELYSAHRNGVSARDSTRGNYVEVQRECDNGKQLTIMNAAEMLIIERQSAKNILKILTESE